MKDSTLSYNKYNKHICDNCGENFFIKYNDTNNNNDYIDCYEFPDGYYLDRKNSLYKLCYISCKICDIEGNETNHNCIECKDEYNYSKYISNYKNCFSHEIINITNSIIETTKEINNEIIYEKMNSNTVEIITNKQGENMNRTLQNLYENLLRNLNLDEINKGKDIIETYKNLTLIFSSTNNQKNKENIKGAISLNMGKCEYLLKDNYNISYNDSLYLLEIISYEEGMKIPKIEYEVYYPLENNSNLTKLNLGYCKNTKIEFSIPVKINDTLDKYNPKSNYYNDICTPITSSFGTDITLDDRRIEFINNNMSLCEENCELKNENKNY